MARSSLGFERADPLAARVRREIAFAIRFAEASPVLPMQPVPFTLPSQHRQPWRGGAGAAVSFSGSGASFTPCRSTTDHKYWIDLCFCSEPMSVVHDMDENLSI
jgi:hypothetical protein